MFVDVIGSLQELIGEECGQDLETGLEGKTF